MSVEKAFNLLEKSTGKKAIIYFLTQNTANNTQYLASVSGIIDRCVTGGVYLNWNFFIGYPDIRRIIVREDV